MDKKKFLNILLLPGEFYRKLTDNRVSLVFGILLVGIVDLSITVIENYSKFFSGKSQSDLIYNISLLVVLVLLIALIDVIFFNVPLFDLFKRFKKEVETPSTSRVIIKLMKIYIIANLMYFPFFIAIFFISKHVNLEQYPAVANILFLVIIAVYVWYYAIITRGINSIYHFEPLFKSLVFPVVFIWGHILSQYVMPYLIDDVALKIFK